MHAKILRHFHPIIDISGVTLTQIPSKFAKKNCRQEKYVIQSPPTDATVNTTYDLEAIFS
jgi:hypothetical protein